MLYQQIDFTKRFVKQLKRLRPNQQQRFYDRLLLFQADPYAKTLRNHALKGSYVGFRSIDIASDLRALYYVEGDRLVIFAFIGTHGQLYG